MLVVPKNIHPNQRMKIELNLYATLQRYFPVEKGEGANIVEADEGITVEGLLSGYDVPINMVKIIFVNGVHSKADRQLQDGDRVGVFPPVGGG